MVHNEAIIQWMIAVIVSATTYLFVRAVFGKKQVEAVAAAAGSTSLDQIQLMIKKILDQTAAAERIMATVGTASAVAVPLAATGTSGPAPVAAAAPAAATPAGGGTPGVDPAELLKLRKVLSERDEELARLRNSGNIDDRLRAQIARVQELESKLKEYEILEDDIADLSLYKEENARLKTELQKFSGQAPTPSEELVAQFAQVLDQSKTVVEGSAAPAAAPVEAKTLEPTGDTVTDFASAVQLEKAVAAPAAVAEAAPAPAPAPAPVAAAAPVAEAASAAQTMFSGSLDAEPAAAAPSPDSPEATNNLFAEFSSGALDTDRVMEELVSLEALKPAEGADALEESLDTDKLAAQAADLHKS